MTTLLTTRTTPRAQLWAGERAGRYERIARGLYRPVDAPAVDWELVEAAARRHDATVCLTSALAYHNLIDDISEALDIALPRGARIPATKAAIRFHSFDAATFELGRELITIPGTDGLQIGIYSAERSITDAFRLRGQLGYETGVQALRAWLNRGGKPSTLAAFATSLPRSAKLLETLTILTA